MVSLLRTRASEETAEAMRPVVVDGATPERSVLMAVLPTAVVPTVRPTVRDGCTACRACEQVCPTEAIMWRELER